MIAYIFQASICINVLYTVYVLLFCRTTFFAWNRMYLMFALISSFIIPAFTISLPVTSAFNVSYLYFPPVHDVVDLSHYDASGMEIDSGLTGGFAWNRSLSVLYLFILMLLVLRRMRFVWFLFTLSRSKTEFSPDGFRIVRTSLSFPFSFGNRIYLPSKLRDALILEHEKSHINHAHWVDLLIVDVATMIMWFNPMIYVFRRSLKSIHEYQADAHVVSVCGNLPEYLSCLLQQVRINQSGLISPFFSNTLKQRINMMTKNPTPRIFSTIYLFAVPVLILLLAAFSFRKGSYGEDTVRAKAKPSLVVVIDPAHGGNDFGATAADGTHEKDITLAVAMEVAKAARNAGIQVTLTRDIDASLTLAQRTAFAKDRNADVFLSIHADNSTDYPERRGTRVMISSTSEESNLRLANCLINGLKESTQTAVGAVEKGDPYVLKNSPVPAAIVELGFLSNKEDLALLSNAEQRRALGNSIVKGLLLYNNE